MKQQGRPDRKVAESRKVEPNAKAVNPSGVAQLGIKFAHVGFKTSVQAGRGYFGPTPQPQAAGPGGGRTIRPCGSQGRH